MTIPASATQLLRAGLDLLYPAVCQICNEERVTPGEGFVCTDCRDKVRFIEPPFCQRCGLPFQGDLTTPFECSNCVDLEFDFSSARSAVQTGKVILDVIHRFKYHRALWFEPFLAEVFLQEAAPVLRSGNWDYIVPVPLHPAKKREREFNQAEHMAGHLSRATGIPVNTHLLRRIRPTETQTHLTRAMRADNVRSAFALRDGQSGIVTGKRFVLVDDVFTTGATTNACASVLRKARAAEVCVWTVARGL